MQFHFMSIIFISYCAFCVCACVCVCLSVCLCVIQCDPLQFSPCSVFFTCPDEEDEGSGKPGYTVVWLGGEVVLDH